MTPAVAGDRPEPIPVFIAYSHQDEALRDALVRQLAVLERSGQIRLWFDRKLIPGDDWNGQIATHLDEARIFLLLVSADFVASKFCTTVEMKRALERHASGNVRVVPVILRPTLWRESELSALQALPKDGRAITLWDNQDAAWVDVVEGVKSLADWLRNAALKGTTKPLPEGMAQHIIAGLKEMTAISRSSGEKSLQRAVATFQAEFMACRGQFQLLSGFKAMHDCLHNLQLGPYSRLAKLQASFPDDADTVEEVTSLELDLEQTVAQLYSIQKGKSGMGPPAARLLEMLTQAQTLLEEAVAGLDRNKLAHSVRRLRPLVAQEPSRINAMLYAAAASLRLQDLSASLQLVCSGLGEAVDPGRARRFEDGMKALMTVGAELKSAAEEHNLWQNADNLLRRIESADPMIEELEVSWPDVKADVEPLYLKVSDDWAVKLRVEGQKLEAALQARDAARLPACFRQFRSRAAYRFFDVDAGLKNRCDDLERVAAPLNSMLEVIDE